ncbi:MAG: hypothetical protein KIH89_002925 [Candidatus Shapirobacteria bacterium]|nr:hypothetical protein [Candidatus Shapirobacteria bacterium]
MMKTNFLILIILILGFIFQLQTKSLLAQSFDSASYHIDWGNFNMTSGKKTSTNYQLTDTVGQNAPGKFTSTGFIVKSGFQYIYDSMEKFSFSISDISLDFGSLTPNIGSTQSNTISITTPSGKGYEILTIANHPLQTIASATIPDTTCDTSCTISSSGVWSSSTKYGFGFNAIGINSSGAATNIGTSSYFTDSTYFRPFAATSRSESPQTVMSENSPVKNRSARITYKINISRNQPSGDYENLINLIAIPKY